MAWGGTHFFFFFWWVCSAQVFKNRVYRTDFFFKFVAKISVFGAETFRKSEINGPKIADFFENWKTEGIRTVKLGVKKAGSLEQ